MKIAARFGIHLTLSVSALLWAGCGGGGNSIRVTTPQNSPQEFANVRFINGSSAAGPIVVNSPLQSTSAIQYANVSPYYSVTASEETFTVRPQLGNWEINCSSPFGLSPETYYTVVVVGMPTGSGNQALQCQFFDEPYALPASGSAQLLFHNAAPVVNLLGNAALEISTYTPTDPPTPASFASSLGTATFSTEMLNNAVAGSVVSATFPGVTSGSGIGFVVAAAPSAVGTASPNPPPTSSPSPLASIVPSDAYLGSGNSGSLPDPQNWFPVANSLTMSIYAIDGPTPGACELVAVID